MDLELEELFRAAQLDLPGAREQLARVLTNMLSRHNPPGLTKETTEDVVQRTLMVVFENLPEFAPRRTFGGWAVGIARNVTRKEFEARERRKKVIEAMAGVPEIARTGNSTVLRRSEQAQIARALLEGLPKHLREALESEDPKALARERRIADATVRSQRRRTLAKLRSRYEFQVGPPEEPVSKLTDTRSENSR